MALDPSNALNQLIAAAVQSISYKKTGGRTTVANGWFTLFDVAGAPGAGVLAGTSTAAGVVPTDLTAGFPVLTPFGSGNTGYLSGVEFGNTVACRLAAYEVLFKAGAYAFNANTALAASPDFLARVPGGTAADTAGATEIWIEQVTAATGQQAVNVTYTNSAGTTGRTTGAVGIGAAPTLGRMWQLPFQSGDSGVSEIDNVAGSVATAGTFNVLVLRPLWSGRVLHANYSGKHNYLDTNLARMFDTTALLVMVNADSTAAGVPELTFTIKNA